MGMQGLTATPMYIGETLHRGTQNLSHLCGSNVAYGYAKPFPFMWEQCCIGVRKTFPIYVGAMLHMGTQNLSIYNWE